MSDTPEIISVDPQAPYRNSLRQEDIVKIEETLGPKEVASWAFRPLGARVVSEMVTYEIFAPEGVLAPFGLPEKPVYRLMLADQMHGKLPVRLGDIFYSQATSGLQIPNNFPRVRRTGEQHHLIIQEAASICGVFPGYAWSKEEENMVMETQPPIPEDVAAAVKKLTLSLDEASKVEIEPLGDHVLIEHVPNQAMQGLVRLPQGNKNLPMFKVLKIGSKELWPNFLTQIEPGDVLMMQGLGPHMLVPHRLRGVELDEAGEVVESGGNRDIFMAPIGLAMGWYPSMRNI